MGIPRLVSGMNQKTSAETISIWDGVKSGGVSDRLQSQVCLGQRAPGHKDPSSKSSGSYPDPPPAPDAESRIPITFHPGARGRDAGSTVSPSPLSREHGPSPALLVIPTFESDRLRAKPTLRHFLAVRPGTGRLPPF